MARSKDIKIRLSQSFIGKEEKLNVMKALDHGYLGMGNFVNEFEKKLKLFFKRETVCVVNGTAALHLAFQAINLKKGDEVLVPSITYVSTFQAISATGAMPIACDVNSFDCLIDLEDAKKKITKRTKAIVPVHFAGEVGDLDKIYDFATKNKLRIVEDAAHAFGTIYKKKRVGSFGDIVCFSFDGIKNITSGEGGCIVTKDKTVINRVKTSRLLGVEKDTENRILNKRSWKFDVLYQGWRYHQSNIMAAIGIAQLKKSNLLFKKRQVLAKQYDYNLVSNEFISIFKHDYNNIVPHIYVIKIKHIKVRDRIQNKLKENGIEYGLHYFPNHLLSLYKKKRISLKNSESLLNQLITLPLHPNLRKKDINYICKLINSCT